MVRTVISNPEPKALCEHRGRNTDRITTERVVSSVPIADDLVIVELEDDAFQLGAITNVQSRRGKVPGQTKRPDSGNNRIRGGWRRLVHFNVGITARTRMPDR